MKRKMDIFFILVLLILFSVNLHPRKLSLSVIGNTGLSVGDVKGMLAKFGVEIKPTKALWMVMMIDHFFNPYNYNSESEKYTRTDVAFYGERKKRINNKVNLSYGGGPVISFGHDKYNYMGKKTVSNNTDIGIGGMVRGDYSLSDKLLVDFELGAKHIFVEGGATYITFSSGLIFIFPNK